ncbi:unnamed protein product [Symbiodinium natans]|uniref:Uncharacterized protein n=1 Tax=Symbiodinium natans TaxID=878477 RepID=A0A812J8U5_9DINO|nr:unnamed protein product [Symbiodinium natans]
MLMMLALAGRLRPSKGPTDADDSCPAGRLSPSKGPTDADDARPCRAPQAPLQLMLIALAGLRPSKVPTARLVGSLRPSKGPTDADDARLFSLMLMVLGEPVAPDKASFIGLC